MRNYTRGQKEGIKVMLENQKQALTDKETKLLKVLKEQLSCIKPSSPFN